MISLWEEIEDTIRLLKLSLQEAKERGLDAAHKEAVYYGAKDKVAFELEREGKSVTLIQTTIKGHEGVVENLEAFRKAQVEYDNAREARNVYKKILDTLREEYAREWGQAKEQ